jgi:3-deoxy-D-manno-octulosonic-acid transferase
MIDFLFFLLYRWLLVPLVLNLLKLLQPWLPAKIKLMLEERSSPQRPAIWARPIWIHAASGEIEYAKPVLRALKAQYPEIPLVVTYFSPSALRLLQGFKEVDFILPVPWDQVAKVRQFLDYCNPVAVLFSRTDVWPELAFQLNQREIPTLLFSATLSTQSGRARGFGKFLARFAFNRLTEIYCVNEEDRRTFLELGVRTPVRVLGDTRFDQVLFRLANPKKLKIELKPKSAKVLIAGSTWPQDEKVLLPCLPAWIASGGAVVLAPHETDETHLLQIENSLRKLELKSFRYSLSETPIPGAIMIIDQIGILPEVYSWGSVAFVGGSFKDRVHSVMEPLAAGLPVLVGPYHQNNREALHFNLQFLHEKLTIVTVTRDSEDITIALTKLFAQDMDQERTRHHICQAIINQTGASDKISKWPPLILSLQKLQPKPRPFISH